MNTLHTAATENGWDHQFCGVDTPSETGRGGCQTLLF